MAQNYKYYISKLSLRRFSSKCLVIRKKVVIFAAKFLIKKFVDMKNESKTYKEEMFEGEDFVRECLESFDENVSAIEVEYAFTNKSA